MDWKIEVIPVPVSDIDRAKAFYSEQCGFHVDHDTNVIGGPRIIQLTPRGSGCSIVIGTGLTQTPPGSIQGIQIVVEDVAAAREELLSRGVQMSGIYHYGENGRADGPGGRWNVFADFADPDGNTWVLQERPAEG